MADWVFRVVQGLGYAGIALLTLLENVFPPIPSEVIMPLAGFIAGEGKFSLMGAIVAGSAGSLAGSTVWYFIGRRVGSERLRQWVDKHGRWITMSNEDVDKVHQWFQRRGGIAVFIGRLIPGIRTWISVPAGLNEMPFWPFMLYSALGTLIWTTLLTTAGYWLGSNFKNLEEPLGMASTAVFIGIGVWYVWRQFRWNHHASQST
jgi:membrane protein DedA with SNARE-associated domain